MKKRNFKIAVVALNTILICAGCAKKPPPPAEESPPPFQRDEQSLAGLVKQERSKIQNDFDNFAIYYLSYELEMGKPQANGKDFKQYMVRKGQASLVPGMETEGNVASGRPKDG